jgi:hypothetical protein
VESRTVVRLVLTGLVGGRALTASLEYKSLCQEFDFLSRDALQTQHAEPSCLPDQCVAQSFLDGLGVEC